MATGERFPIGVLYEGGSETTFAERFRNTVTEAPLTTLAPPAMENIEQILSEFRALKD